MDKAPRTNIPSLTSFYPVNGFLYSDTSATASYTWRKVWSFSCTATNNLPGNARQARTWWSCGNMLKIDNNTFNIEVSKNKKILPELNTGVVQQVHSDDFLQSTVGIKWSFQLSGMVELRPEAQKPQPKQILFSIDFIYIQDKLGCPPPHPHRPKHFRAFFNF